MKKTIAFLIFISSVIGCLAQQNISAEEANELIKNEKNIQILDVRTPQEFAAGHIENAVNIDIRDAKFAEKVSELKKRKTVLIYCRSGRRSLNAMNKMDAMKFKKLYNMKGGLIEWGKKFAVVK